MGADPAEGGDELYEKKIPRGGETGRRSQKTTSSPATEAGHGITNPAHPV